MDAKTIAKMTAQQLREQLAKYPDVQGLTALKKDKLVALLCSKLGIDMHAHAATSIDKSGIKQQIRALKKQRAVALEAKDHAKLEQLRHAIHRQKHLLRRAVKQADAAAAKAKS